MEEIKKQKPKKSNKVNELEELKNNFEQLNEKFLRTLADMKNQRRIHGEEIDRIRKYEGELLILKLLDVVDDFERAITTPSNLTDELRKFLNGFEMIYAGLVSVLKEMGVHEIECLNETFDPNIAEAILTEKVKDKESDIVIDILLKGYKYKDKVLRPAKVKVSE
jgi:molecular chaperone GrpE